MNEYITVKIDDINHSLFIGYENAQTGKWHTTCPACEVDKCYIII